MFFSFAEIGRELAIRGKNASSLDMAIAHTDPTTAGIMTLVDNLNKMACAIANPSRKEINLFLPPDPEEIGSYPDVHLGRLLYRCFDLSVGVTEFICIGQGDNHSILLIRANPEPFLNHRPFWAHKEFYLTATDAIRANAEGEIQEYAPLIELAQQALADIKAGGDLTRWIEGDDPSEA